jgi:hypothetical protein
MTTSQDLSHQPLTHTSLLSSKRSASRTAHEPSVRRGRKPRLNKPRVRNFESFGMGGRPGFAASENIDFARPGYGSVQVGEGRYYWIAFRRLRDWMEGGPPLDSGFHTSEVTAHDSARAEVRPFLRVREALPPMPEAFILAHYNRMVVEKLAKEAAARYMALIERGDEIAGYEWVEVCRFLGDDSYDLVDIDEAA